MSFGKYQQLIGFALDNARSLVKSVRKLVPMMGTVKKLHSGIRTFQKRRALFGHYNHIDACQRLDALTRYFREEHWNIWDWRKLNLPVIYKRPLMQSSAIQSQSHPQISLLHKHLDTHYLILILLFSFISLWSYTLLIQISKPFSIKITLVFFKIPSMRFSRRKI